MEPLLEVRRLSVDYATERGALNALDDVSVSLAAGQTLGVVGETGCGKSTLGKAILDVLPLNAKPHGQVLYRGKDLLTADRESARRLRGKEIALIFQEPMTRLNPLLTIEDHLVEEIRAHDDVTVEQARARAIEALESMGIPESRVKNFPHEFSGGMRQRIMIALALVMRPWVLVADEPTTSLDVIVEAQILQILEDLRRAYKLALLLITHNLGIVAEACDDVAVLYAGKLVEIAPVRDIFAHPVHPYTQGLLKSVIHLETRQLFSIEGSPPDLVNPPSGCRFHPRCPFAKDICQQEVPALLEYRPGHYAACHFGKDFA